MVLIFIADILRNSWGLLFKIQSFVSLQPTKFESCARDARSFIFSMLLKVMLVQVVRKL